ncbi:hypothetical protein ACHAXT_007038 [Thalassiosira profunda]
MAEETTAVTGASSRAPFALPTYALGDEGKPDHFAPAVSRETAAEEAKALDVGDAAFIKRSDLKWTYALVTEKVTENDSTVLRFEVDVDKNRKSFPEAQWGKYIRVIKAGEAEMAALAGAAEAEAAAVAAAAEAEAARMAEAEAAGRKEAEAKIEKAMSAEVDSGSVKSNKSNKSGSWFGGIFGTSASKSKEEEPKPEAVPEEAPEARDEEEATPSLEPSIETPYESAPEVKESVATAVVEPTYCENLGEAALDAAACIPPAKAPEPLNTKENEPVVEEVKITSPKVFLPSQAKEESGLKSPLGLKKLGSRLFAKKATTPKVAAASPMNPQGNLHFADPKSPKMVSEKTEAAGKKEWFDPEACEVDYDKNPTDLFQALEARQFSYAEEMLNQVPQQFNKECRTWVVARGQKKRDSAQLRFRALPLHAALVFGAPDAMVVKILNAYPKATRGRDVKGRLPIHLAMEHDASEPIVCALLEAFPKGFHAKDKKDMTPLDYVNGNMARRHMKVYLPLVADAKVEVAREEWEAELEKVLAYQKEQLRSDPEYMEDVIAAINDEVETQFVEKMELLEGNYKKEIELLRKKHDSETQALLEGFEVKLNFERKLNKLKGKK